MVNIASNRWIQLGAASIIAVVIGAVIGTSLLPSAEDVAEEIAALTPPRGAVLLMTGEAPRDRSYQPGGTSIGIEGRLELPLTAAAAVAAGWKDPGQCLAGQGRYFTKGTAGEGEPYVLMYNKADNPIGIYHFSLSELPAPFTKKAGLTEAGLSADHWGLFIYFVDPTNAC